MSEATHLTCVKCTSVLDRATFEGLEVDLCPHCGGLWLDRGEITRAARLPEGELDRLRGHLSATTIESPPEPSHPVPCPACEGKLSEVILGNVHVDYCGTCHGIFLDRGELEEALTAVRARDATATASQVFAAAVSAAR
jgi:Zn-finger nucleic acid-binding protein